MNKVEKSSPGNLSEVLTHCDKWLITGSQLMMRSSKKKVLLLRFVHVETDVVTRAHHC